ncbi:Eif2s3p [Ordospora colligata]|uniref:Eukaryotic translation initiation factor 2 subunit gamma n=1 Tax=Ordospora colligata OC4 TaxID=1354746 RepID=A0A0B2UH62_9MICR|nr:eukaryotic translation initiation factor 2 [Ordospora colligata OC4]KHN70406.1 eukaryotic translation initiation factor 2 [Ordospora colligata OC4]TBU17156.1 eukaryotic translation initiation factor 2 [Ordospora colligata]TBU17406.1 eukaryotic translation initiation factor 2 [Ordospora colligata]
MRDASEVMKKQATLNIGTIGHVAHGKSTIVKAISSVSTIKFKTELERNITIKLGYANAKIYKCDSKCIRPNCYQSFSSSTPDELPCNNCGGILRLVRHVSFVDCPGHDVLMATMLNGTAIMDAVLLVIAANEPCPQPQTIEHLFAVEIMNLKKMLVVQNKIDLVSREQALEQHEQIQKFLKTSNVFGPVVPTAAQVGVNIPAILDFIVNYIPEPIRNDKAHPKMVVIRSFDVNRPGTCVRDLCGGVIGGSLVTGLLKTGDEIEIRPGSITKNGSKFVCRPFVSKVVSLKAESTSLEEACPGGLIGVGTTMDPFFCKADKLVGQVMGLLGHLPSIFCQIDVNYKLFQKTSIQSSTKLKNDEQVLVNIGSTTTGGVIRAMSEEMLSLDLVKPACCEIGERIAISRKVQGHWRLIGHGEVKSGKTVEPVYDN